MNSGTFWRRLTRGVQRVFQRDEWTRVVGHEDAAQILNAATTDRFHAKQGRTTARWVIENEGGSLAVYLKRHFKLPWWRRLLATLWPGSGWTPAFTEKRNLEWANVRGISVPEPLAAAEIVGPWFRLQCFLAVKELTGMAPLNELAVSRRVELSQQMYDEWKKRVLTELAALVRRLHERRRFHKDLYLCHLFLPRCRLEEKNATMHLIDLGRLTHSFVMGWYLRIKDLAQLFYSFDGAGLSERDALRFYHAYVGEKKLGRRSRWLLAAVRAKANRYRGHNAKRIALLTDRETERKSVAA